MPLKSTCLATYINLVLQMLIQEEIYPIMQNNTQTVVWPGYNARNSKMQMLDDLRMVLTFVMAW